MKIALVGFALVLSVRLAPGWAAAAGERTLWQNMPLTALLNGFYPGNFTLSDALRHGDFGLGAFADLDGEMIINAGKVYRFRDTGTVDRAPMNSLGAFAAITSFHPDRSIPIPVGTDLARLGQILRSAVSAGNNAYAIRLRGSFTTLATRAPHRQTQAIAFCEAVKTQATFTFTSVRGIMVGYFTPAYMSSLAGSGYHFHFISLDEKSGGHVLEFQTEDVTAELERLDKVEVAAPPEPAFQSIDLSRTITCPDQ